ncbi:MAG: Protein-S-isoprenylcysteineO-methyltransferase [Candidatus Nomurabacteria bacterium GW2011_GWF2_36_19]|nr:MAG: Protein-S-isoprenylcysteineO-methyltransferase [Candidatus Nomurabacteria bacterium GW2011_GWF2_36_19]KKQ05929.1 MAG: Protein-S-isoprenylcysteineO-methyltransferase [Candidatus Nomurabacteria bacterium GW2011_GWF1_36_47]
MSQVTTCDTIISMREEEKIERAKERERAKTVGVIHILLFHTYIIFLGAVILGVIFDQIFHFDLFKSLTFQYLGIVMILWGSILVYWAQSTTSQPKSEVGKERDTNFFYRGPYKYTRNPTNLGLTMMSLGLGFLLNSLFSIIFIVITYLISRFIFIKKQDKILVERYGDVFTEYKKRVKDWL